VHAERREAEVAIALVPGDRVRERANAVELREVEEVKEHRAAGGGLGQNRIALDVVPGATARQGRGGDVVSLGAHGSAG
jgi:hypothetical protein